MKAPNLLGHIIFTHALFICISSSLLIFKPPPLILSPLQKGLCVNYAMLTISILAFRWMLLLSMRSGVKVSGFGFLSAIFVIDGPASGKELACT